MTSLAPISIQANCNFHIAVFFPFLKFYFIIVYYLAAICAKKYDILERVKPAATTNVSVVVSNGWISLNLADTHTHTVCGCGCVCYKETE